MAFANMVLSDFHPKFSVRGKASVQGSLDRCNLVTGCGGAILYFSVAANLEIEQKSAITCHNSAHNHGSYSTLYINQHGWLFASTSPGRFAHAGSFNRDRLAIGTGKRISAQICPRFPVVVVPFHPRSNLPNLSKYLYWGCIRAFLACFFYGNFVLLALLQNENKVRLNFFNNKLLEWFGLRSYGIYLFHKPIQISIPLLLAKFIRATFSQWIVLTITIIVLIIAAEVSYRILERPIMALGHRFKYE